MDGCLLLTLLMVPGQELQGWISTLISLILLIMVLVLSFTSQQMQVLRWRWEIERNLNKLETLVQNARSMVIKKFKERYKVDPVGKLDRMLEFFTIEPVSDDPRYVMERLEHLLDVRKSRFETFTKSILPEASDAERANAEVTVEALIALNTLYRVIRHYLYLGKKLNSMYIIMQLHMLLPLLMRQAYALYNCLGAFIDGKPIGDGIGPIVAAHLIGKSKVKRIAKDTVYAKVKKFDRNLFVVKAEGPGGNVGKLGDAVKNLIVKYRIDAVIMVDAALKLEGELSGSVVDGVGAAIGGPGVDKYKIEEICRKKKIPLYAVIVKEDYEEAITPIKKEIIDSADEVIKRIGEILLENTEKDGNVIIACAGNTIGVGQ